MRPRHPENVAAFAALIEEQLGLDPQTPSAQEMEALLRERLHATGSRDVDAYRGRLATPSIRRAEMHALAERLAVGETYFFREPRDFETFARVAVPRRLVCPAAGPPLRVLSVGCSSGDEVYSLAIALRESTGPRAADACVHGVDVNARAIERARRALYSNWALRSTPSELRERYFRPCGQGHELVDEVRRAVTFEERNLLDDDPAFWQPGSFDVIFCRNVLMYFSARKFAAAIRLLASALAPGGFLFLGYSESLHVPSKAFELLHANGGFCYVRKGASAAPAWSEDHDPGGAPRPRGEDKVSWMETIHRASEKVNALAARLSRSTDGCAAPPEGTEAPAGRALEIKPPLERAAALFQAERFQEALTVLEREPPGPSSREETQLLRAAILTNQGSLTAAEEVLNDILRAAPLNSTARYLIAICRSQDGDVREAIEHHRRAIEANPAFAMSYLQLGMLARRSGDRAAARASLRAAIDLLEREDTPTLALLSGGFSRGALIEMCRAELDACGKAP
jgi:chemotaxis protein methyltransferase CheR